MATLQWNARTERYEGAHLTVTRGAMAEAVEAATAEARQAAYRQDEPFDETAAAEQAETACLEEDAWSIDTEGVEPVAAYLDRTMAGDPEHTPIRCYHFGSVPDRAFDEDGPLAGLNAEAAGPESYASSRAAALFKALGVSPDAAAYVLGVLPDGRWALHGELAADQPFAVED